MPNSTPRLYITFYEKTDVIRRAVTPLRSTYQEVLLDTLRTYGLPEDHADRYDFKYGRRLEETVVWMELAPESWSLIDNRDDLLLYYHWNQEVGSQTTPMESSVTLVPPTDATPSVQKNAQETKLFNEPSKAKPIVRYRYAKVIKGVEKVAYATSFLPDTYEEAVNTAVSTIKTTTLGEDLELGRVALWVRILDEKGNRYGAVVPPEQLIEFMRETLKKDPFCTIGVMPFPKV
ncbi:hypothetical protein D9619_009319 [Psilocybe cf. subviscida]|uniref:Uncharacterized protein n=1 Tax=Psilocybe cf. subviscida TaxID=2480587 RepID=A0A8H5BTT3_9AGAR|nr:hypothetical protein D9619_009319 [Psilocybe cf. subviscida]